jgi:UPF0042 nucleotide-binding protein
MPDKQASAQPSMQVVLITGVSGSGKSVAIAALEDAGYYCVDNLPAQLLVNLVQLQQQHHVAKMAVATDVRSAASLPQLLPQIQQLRQEGVSVQIVFLDASTDSLVHRFSETRRAHPLSTDSADSPRLDLMQAIETERDMLSRLRDQALVLDTSLLKPAQLRTHIKELLQLPSHHLTLVFESFAFKRGVPLDADYVFDVRMLPNPYYDLALRPLTGKDTPVADFLRTQLAVQDMINDIGRFLDRWMPHLGGDHRSYVTVAIGCTGGQHRSVFIAESLTQIFSSKWPTRVRHREL